MLAKRRVVQKKDTATIWTNSCKVLRKGLKKCPFQGSHPYLKKNSYTKLGLGNPFCNFTEVILMNAKNHDIEGKYANNSLLCVMFSVKGKVVSSMEFCLWLLEETSASAAPTERPTWLFQAGRKNDFTRFYKILYQRRWGGRLTWMG